MVFDQKDKSFGLAILLATLIVAPGWWFSAHEQEPRNLLIKYAAEAVFVLNLPGLIPAIFISILLSPQGVHGDEFVWLQFPLSFGFYAFVFFKLLNRRQTAKARLTET